MGTMNATKPQEDSTFCKNIPSELEQSILKEKDPVQKALGKYELKNPSVGPDGRMVNRAKFMYDLEIVIPYKAIIIKDRVGTDFMTNQPTFKEREIILEYL